MGVESVTDGKGGNLSCDGGDEILDRRQCFHEPSMTFGKIASNFYLLSVLYRSADRTTISPVPEHGHWLDVLGLDIWQLGAISILTELMPSIDFDVSANLLGHFGPVDLSARLFDEPHNLLE